MRTFSLITISSMTLLIIMGCESHEEPVDPLSECIENGGTFRACMDEFGDPDWDGDGWFASEDCDDSDAATYPDADELCDGIDNDCDGSVPADEMDGDGDSFRICGGDCNDGDGTVAPNLPEICANSVDDNCDRRVDEVAGEVAWNVLDPSWDIEPGDVQALPVTSTTGITHNVDFWRTPFHPADWIGNARPFTPSGTTDGSFVTSGGPLTGVTVGWRGTQPYMDILENVVGWVDYDMKATAPEAFGAGWHWVVGIAGTGGVRQDPSRQVPVTITSENQDLTFIGHQDAFGSGVYATFTAPRTIVGSSTTAVDGYSFFLLPDAATEVRFQTLDAGYDYEDQHGMIIGAISLSTCVTP